MHRLSNHHISRNKAHKGAVKAIQAALDMGSLIKLNPLFPTTLKPEVHCDEVTALSTDLCTRVDMTN